MSKRLDRLSRDLTVLYHCNKKAGEDDYSKYTDDDDNGDQKYKLFPPVKQVFF